MRDIRRKGESSVGGGAAAGGASPGKRTRTERFGGARVERRGEAMTGGDAQAQPQPSPGQGGDVENPMGDPGAQPLATKTRATVTITESTAPPLTFNAKDYRELYGQVAQRSGKEAGSVTRSAAAFTDGPTDPDGNLTSVTIKYDLATMLPEWPQKGTQPAEDQAKFNAWRASVAEHEKGHRDIYKRELGKERTQVVGPKTADIDAQVAAVEAAAETEQDKWDAAGQPAPLAAPGGIEHVPRNSTDGQPQPDASADPPAADTASV